ncbi:MAG: hypothetical protein ABSE90_13620, partial [Verrucomicrobiota bacterium]
MQTYDPAKDPEKLRQVIKTIHGELKDRLGTGVTLQNVRDKLFEIHGLDLDEAAIGKLLDQALSGKRQGQTVKSARAHEASDAASQASLDANENPDAASHNRAAAYHTDAAAAHREAARFHDSAEKWHLAKADGKEVPEEIE